MQTAYPIGRRFESILNLTYAYCNYAYGQQTSDANRDVAIDPKFFFPNHIESEDQNSWWIDSEERNGEAVEPKG